MTGTIEPQTVSLRAITKKMADLTILDDVSLEIGAGQLVALLGESGCGKTTLLRTIAGLSDPDSGQVVIGGRDLTQQPTRRRPIGLLFQNYALFPNMTVADNIAFPLKAHKRPPAERKRRVADLVDLVGLSGKENRYPSQLSGGQQQRVALARALAPEPAVLLLDEPLSALDAIIRENLRDEIRRVQQEVGITAVYVTHDQTEAMAIADQVAVMSHGRVVECASPAEIYDRPESRYAAEFVGSRNTIELPIGADRHVSWDPVFSLPAPDGANGKALAVFRPEDLRRSDRGALHGTVEVTIFLGSTTRVYAMCDDVRVAADLPSREAVGLAPGVPIRLDLEPGLVRLYPV